MRLDHVTDFSVVDGGWLSNHFSLVYDCGVMDLVPEHFIIFQKLLHHLNYL